MATAKQLLQFLANKGTEQDAARVLSESGIKFKDSSNLYTVNADGQMENVQQGVVNIGMGQVTGFTWDDLEPEPDAMPAASGGKTDEGLNPDGGTGDLNSPPGGIPRGPVPSEKAPTLPVANPVQTATQVGSGETLATTPAPTGAKQAVAAVPSPAAGVHAAAAGGHDSKPAISDSKPAAPKDHATAPAAAPKTPGPGEPGGPPVK